MEYVKEINAVLNRFIKCNARCFSVCRSDVYRAHRIFPVYKGAGFWLGKTMGEMFRDRRVRRRRRYSLSFSLFVRRLQRHLEQGISQVWRQR